MSMSQVHRQRRQMRRLRYRIAAICAAVLGAGQASNSHAINYYFDTNGATAGSGVTPAGSYVWNQANWNTNSTGTGATGSTPTWTNGAAGVTNDVFFSAGTDAGASAFTVALDNTAGNDQTWVNSLTMQANGGNVNINATSRNFVLASNQTWTTPTGTSLTVSGLGNVAWGALNMNGRSLIVNSDGTTTIAGMGNSGGSLTKTGTGLLNLNGNSTYTGVTNVNAGTLEVQGTYATPTYNIASGAVLELDTGAVNKSYSSTTFAGAGTLRKTGTAQALWGASAATFAMTSGSLIDIQQGEFVGGSSANENWVNNFSDLNIAAGATFSGVEANVRIDALTGAGTLSTGWAGAGYQNFTMGVDNGSGTFNGVIQNGPSTGNIVKTGSGVQVLTGTNTYTGTTTVNQGVLQIGNGTTAGSIAATSPVTVASGATIAWNNNNTTAGKTIGNAISGAGNVLLQGQNVAGPSQLSIYTNAATMSAFTGTWTLNRSLLWNTTNQAQLGAASSIVVQDSATMGFNGGTYANNITIENGAGWHHNVSGSDVVIGAIRLEGTNVINGNITLNQATGITLGDNTGAHSTVGAYGTGNHTFNGVISGTGEFSMSRFTAWNGGSATDADIILAGSSSNTYTGKTVVDGQHARADLWLSKTGGAIAIQGGNVVQMGSATGGQANLRMGQNEQFGTNNGGVQMNFVNAAGQWMRFDLKGTTQTLAGINAGTLTTQGGAVIQNQGIDGVVPAGDATLTLIGSGNYLYNGYIRDQDNGGTTRKLNLIKEGTGIQTFAGNQITYTGTTTINEGEIVLAAANLGRGDWTINDGGILRGTATDSINLIRSITVNAGGKLIQSGGSYQQLYNGGAGGNVLILNGGSVEATVAGHGNYGNFLLRGNVVVGGTQTSTISADFRMGDNATRIFNVADTGDASDIDLDITGNFSHFNGVTWGYMNKTGAGTMRFASTSNNQVGKLTITDGKVLMVDNLRGWGNGGIDNNATFEDNLGTGITVNYGSALVGTGTFIKSGNGLLIFNGGNQTIRQGQFNILGGTIQNNNNSVNWSTNTGDMHIASGAIMDLYADAVFVDQLTGTGFVQNNYGNSSGFSGSGQFIEKLVVGVANGSSTFGGVIRNNSGNLALGSAVGRGGISLIKEGTGTQTLSGVNTYSGTTTISAGTLALLGAGSIDNSPVISIASGATFDVEGASNYNLTSIQSLIGNGTINGNVITDAGSIISPGATPGAIGTLTFLDDLDINGILRIDVNGNGAGSTDLINVAGVLDISGATLDFDLVNTINDPFYIFASYGSLVGQFSSITGMSASGYEVKYNFQGNNIALVMIPEPATMSLLALGSLGLLRRRRVVG